MPCDFQYTGQKNCKAQAETPVCLVPAAICLRGSRRKSCAEVVEDCVQGCSQRRPCAASARIQMAACAQEVIRMGDKIHLNLRGAGSVLESV